MKILILTPVWRRPEILRIFLKRLSCSFPRWINWQLVVVLSPEDPEYEINRKLCDRHTVVHYRNQPLGEKKNAGLNHAKSFEWDYLFELGSDDILNPAIWDFYRPFLEEREAFFGINNFYFYDIHRDRAGYVEGYNYDDDGGERRYCPFGAGRMIRRDVVDNAGFNLWRSWWVHGMDGCSRWDLYDRGIMDIVVDIGRMPCLLSLKTLTNLNLGLELDDQVTEWLEPDEVLKMFDVEGMEFRGRKDMDIIRFDCFHREVIELSQQIGKMNAFESVNEKHRQTFGDVRFKNYDSFRQEERRLLKGNK